MNIKTYIGNIVEQEREMVFFVGIVIFFVSSILFMNNGLSLDAILGTHARRQVLAARTTNTQNQPHATSSGSLQNISPTNTVRKIITNKLSPVPSQTPIVPTTAPHNSAISSIPTNVQQPTSAAQSGLHANTLTNPTPTPGNTSSVTSVPSPTMTPTPTLAPCKNVFNSVPCIPQITLPKPHL